jgi:hypothetical protein
MSEQDKDIEKIREAVKGVFTNEQAEELIINFIKAMRDAEK